MFSLVSAPRSSPTAKRSARFSLPAATATSRELDAPLNIGKIEPDFDAAEVRPFRADRGGYVRAQMARRADVFCQLRMHFAQLRDFIHGSRVNFFLRVEARAHGPFVK